MFVFFSFCCFFSSFFSKGFHHYFFHHISAFGLPHWLLVNWPLITSLSFSDQLLSPHDLRDKWPVGAWFKINFINQFLDQNLREPFESTWNTIRISEDCYMLYIHAHEQFSFYRPWVHKFEFLVGDMFEFYLQYMSVVLGYLGFITCFFCSIVTEKEISKTFVIQNHFRLRGESKKGLRCL